MTQSKKEQLEDELNRGRIRTGGLVGGLALCLGTLSLVSAGASVDENNLFAAVVGGAAAIVSYSIGGYLCYAAYDIWRGYKESDSDKKETKR